MSLTHRSKTIHPTLQGIQSIRQRRKMDTTRRARPTGSHMVHPGNNYQTAVNWIQSQETVISTFINLVQTYPALIQEAPLRKFRQFLRSVLEVQSKTTLKREAKYRLKGTNGFQQKSLGTFLPNISNTRDSTHQRKLHSQFPEMERTPKILMISHYTDDLSRTQHFTLLERLQREFYVRSTQCSLDEDPSGGFASKDSSSQAKIAKDSISEADLCVFTFNDSTLEEKACFHELCLAMYHKLPVVFVRKYKYELPKNFSEIVENHSQGSITLARYIEKCSSLARPKSKNQHPGKNKSTQHRRKHTFVGLLSNNATTNRPGCRKDLKDRRLNSSLKRSNRTPSSRSEQTDLLFSLVKNFKTAFVFDEAEIEVKSSKLSHLIFHTLDKERLNLPTIDRDSTSEEFSSSTSIQNDSSELFIRRRDVLGHAQHQTKANVDSNDLISHLKVPDADDYLSTREWANAGSVSAPPYGKPRKSATRRSSLDSTENHDDDDDFSDENGDYDSMFFSKPKDRNVRLSLKERKSSYLIFDDLHNTTGPTRVEYPSTELKSYYACDDTVRSDTEDSSISFYEVDLSRPPEHLLTPESDINIVNLKLES